MRIAYVLTFDPTVHSGLWLRMRERLKVWAEHGLEADVVIACRNDSDLLTTPPIAPHRLRTITANSSFSASHRLPGVLKEIQPDLVYMRYNLPYPGMIRVSRLWPTVLEIHADDIVEWKHRPLRYRALGLPLRKMLLNNAAGFLLVDPGLINSTHYPIAKVPTLVLTNGIQIPSLQSYGMPRYRAQGPPRLALSIGSNEPWQGLDKYAAIAGMTPDLEFTVIGEVGNSIPMVVPDNLRFVGRVDAAEMMATLASVDIGVGNLACERIGRRRPAPLKVREYIAAGLPCVLAHDDPDVAGMEGILELPYGFEPSMSVANDIRNFAGRWVGRACPPALATAVDVVTKETKRLAFLSDIAGRAG